MRCLDLRLALPLHRCWSSVARQLLLVPMIKPRRTLHLSLPLCYIICMVGWTRPLWDFPAKCTKWRMSSFKCFKRRRFLLRLPWNGCVCFETWLSSESVRSSAAPCTLSSMCIASFSSTQTLNSKSLAHMFGQSFNTFWCWGKYFFRLFGSYCTPSKRWIQRRVRSIAI